MTGAACLAEVFRREIDQVERERDMDMDIDIDIDIDMHRERDMQVCIYIYIYAYTHVIASPARASLAQLLIRSQVYSES